MDNSVFVQHLEDAVHEHVKTNDIGEGMQGI
jgi:hypothetical protein